MFFADLPLRQVVGEECVAFMLNWRETDYLTLQVPPSLVMNNPYIKVIFLSFITNCISGECITSFPVGLLYCPCYIESLKN